MCQRSIVRPTFIERCVRGFVLLFPLLLVMPRACPDAVYREEAFLPASWCTSVDISPDKSTVYARAHFRDWNEGVRLYSDETYQHINDFQNLPNVPWTILASADGNYLYASHYYGGAVAKLDASTGQVVKSISVGPWPAWMVFDSARRYLYVGVNCPGTGAVGSISVIDTSTDTVVGSVGLNGEPNHCLVLSPDGLFLYVGTHQCSPERLFKIRVSDRSVVKTLDMPGLHNPAMSARPDGNFLYLADDPGGVVRIIETASLTQTGTYTVPHVQNFSVGPSGKYALATSYTSGSLDVFVHAFDMSSATVVQTIQRTLTGSTQNILMGGSPIVWDAGTGKAYIPVWAEGGGVMVLSPDEEPWQVVYQSDFSADPGWTTNAPQNFYWNEAAGNYYFKRQNGSEQYSYRAIAYDPALAYSLEFDACLTRCDWAADLFLSLSDPDMDIASPTTWQVSYHNVDQGKTASLIYYDAQGGSYHPGGAQPAPFQLDTWYHNVAVCDPAAGTLSLRVTKVSDGSLVGQQELTGVGSFAGVDRLSISAVGHTYASGAIAEGYIDNLVLKSCSGVPQPPVVTQFDINNGAATTESRLVTLNNATENSPTHYMASERSDFTEATWRTYSTAPQFTLSEGDGQKTVYFKTKNEAGESNVVTDSVTLQQAAAVYQLSAFLPASCCYSADMSPDGDVIYASGQFGDWDAGGRLYDARTYEHIKDIHSFPNVPKYILASADGIHLYATAYYEGTVVKVRVADGAVVKSISVGPWPVGMIFDSARRYLYVMVNCPYPGAVGSISIIDTSTDTVVGTIGPIVHAGTVLAISPDDQFLYALSFDYEGSDPQTLYKMSIAERSVVSTVTGLQVGGISVSPDGALLYVADRFAGAVRVFQTNSMTELTPIPVADVHGFWVAPSGDRGLAVCLAPGGSELLVRVVGLRGGQVLQTLSQTLELPDGLSSYPLVDPVFWNGTTGEALIPIFREHGGVLVISPAGEAWEVVYSTDFSSDPGWLTDQAANYYWNQAAGTYHARVENDAPAYSPNRYFYKPVPWTGDSFEIQWDIKMTRADWSAGVSFGLFDESIAFAGFEGGQGVCLEFANPDAGRLLWLYIYGAGGLASASSPGGTYAVNTQYTCRISYEAASGEISAELLDHDSGSTVWSKTLSVPGGFTQPLTKLGGSRSGFGETAGGYSGVNRWGVAEAEIDSVVFSQAGVAAQPPVVAQFAINAGAQTTESRTVTLNNSAQDDPTHYMASEDAQFSGASWQTYSTEPQFTLSEGDGQKTIYFKTKNAAGESNVVSDTITLQEAAWQIVYQSDFSTNPGWTTNAPQNFYWNEAAGNYYFKRQNGSEQYSYRAIAYDPGLAYRLEFDAYLTRCDWAADLFLSLSDPDMHIASATTWQVSYHNVDQGKTASLIYYDAQGGSYHPGGAQPAPFQLNTWYHNVAVYDPGAGTLSLRVTKVSDGSLVGEQELTGVGSFAGVDRLSISAVGHTYASGAIAEGYIDNLVLWNAGASAQPPVVAQFAINSGAATTESRTVTLNNATENNPTHYMASESSIFSGASWQTYSTAPQFSLSVGDGQKTVYFKTKNEAGESNVVSDTITLEETPWQIVYETDFSADPKWTTNDAKSLSWDAVSGTFHGWQSNLDGTYAYTPVKLTSGASFRLRFDVKINFIEWSAGLTFGLFDARLMYNAGAVIEYGFFDVGYTIALYAGNPSGPPDWDVANWETGVSYRNVIEYDAESKAITLEVSRRDDGTPICQLSLSGISFFPPGMVLLGASRVHMAGYNDGAVDFNLDNVALEEFYQPPKREVEIVPQVGPLLRIRWDSEVGKTYQLWATSDLSSGEWVPVGPRMGGTGEKLYIDDYVEGLGNRFYRVEIISPVAESPDYAVVVSESTVAVDGWDGVVNALVSMHTAHLVPFSGAPFPASVKDELAALRPRYVCFVAQPQEVTDTFVTSVHELTRQLDDDPFGDCIWGIITGARPDDAMRLASASSPLEIQTGLLKAAGYYLEWLPRGVFHSEGDSATMWIKEIGGEIDKRTDGPLDDTADLVTGLNSGDYQLFVTSGHASEYNWQLHWPDPADEGFFFSYDGQLYAIDHNGSRFDINVPQPIIYWAPGNCLIGRIAGSYSMALGWLGSGGAVQFCGYVVPTWYGYMGWGLNDYFLKLQDRFSFAEAFFLTNQALIFDQLHGTPGTDSEGLAYDKNAMVFYGDPALKAIVSPCRVPLYNQRLEATTMPDPDQFRVVLTVTTNEDAEIPRPVIAFLPFRIVPSETILGQSQALAVEITDDMVLAQVWVQGESNVSAGERIRVTFTCVRAS